MWGEDLSMAVMAAESSALACSLGTPSLRRSSASSVGSSLGGDAPPLVARSSRGARSPPRRKRGKKGGDDPAKSEAAKGVNVLEELQQKVSHELLKVQKVCVWGK